MAIRMAHLDDILASPRDLVGALALLALAMAAGGFLVQVAPLGLTGRTALLSVTISVAAGLFGGVLALGWHARRVATIRALRQLRDRADDLTDPIWICGEDGVILHQNSTSTQIFGDRIGQYVFAPVALISAEAEAETMDLLRRAGSRGNAELLLNSGDVFAVRQHTRAPLQFWTYRPATVPARPSMERDVFEQLPVALLRLGSAGEILGANLAARNMLPALAAEPAADPLLLGALFEGPGRPIRDWLDDARTGRTGICPEMLRLREGARPGDVTGDRHFQIVLAPEGSDGSGLVAVLSDASAVKTLEAQFVQSQKMQAIGQLAGGVAHDFNNLLTAIRGHCDLLMLRRDRSDPEFADLDQISQNTNRAAALVGQLLAFSRKQTLKLETFDVRNTLSDLAHLLSRLVGEKVELSIENDPALHAIRADRRQLEQVIMNLVVNARDAMPEGGKILVRATNKELSQALARDRVLLPAGSYVCIDVVDNGSGIPAELRDKIFEPFFTTKRMGEGTGLGLSMAYGIIKQTGGHVFCDSTPGQGTCFSLYFPGHDPAGADITVERKPELASLEPGQTATILLVEDEPTVRAFAARALRLRGYVVHEADSAEAALDLLSNSAFVVDVFMSDVVMPGMDGPSWVRTALRDRPRTKVIFMSGYSCDIFGDGYAPIPNAEFLAKPFSLGEMLTLIEAMLDETRPEASQASQIPITEPLRKI
jgi:two-component system cell cycle sensor histidine kinase/response regulator CckA